MTPKQFKSESANIRAHIATLRYVAGALVALCLVLVLTIFWVGREHRLSLPPVLNYGAKLKTGVIHPHEVYSFAGYLIQQLHVWSNDGGKDYWDNLQRLRAYLTQPAAEQLTREGQELSRQDQLQGRQRWITPAAHWNPRAVETIVENQRWLVTLDVHLSEHLAGVAIKDKVPVRFVWPVVARDADPESNPWGLLLDRPELAPQRVAKR